MVSDFGADLLAGVTERPPVWRPKPAAPDLATPTVTRRSPVGMGSTRDVAKIRAVLWMKVGWRWHGHQPMAVALCYRLPEGGVA